MDMQLKRLIIAHKQDLIDQYRDADVGHEWWDYVFEGFTTDMDEKGIEVDQMYFSGFWSQGDGACFEGYKTFTPADVDAAAYPALHQMLTGGGNLTVSCSHRGHYYHENCTSFETVYDTFADLWWGRGELREAVAETLDEMLQDEVERFESDVIDEWRGFMQDLYRQLEEEYDWLTSDATVWSAIKANAWWEGECWYEEAVAAQEEAA